MILKNVVDKSNFDDVYNCLVRNDTKVKDISIDRVKRGYEDIRSLSYKENKDGFTIVIRIIEEGREKHYHVSGLKNEEDILYNLMFSDWEEWLGFEVDEQLISTMDFSEITAHCFWEMTWNGWTMEERESNLAIQEKEEEKGKEIHEIITELKSRSKLISEDILNEIILQYKNAETDRLKIDIEVAIEELIKSRLIVEQQVRNIIDNFDDKDILKAIKKFYGLTSKKSS